MTRRLAHDIQLTERDGKWRHLVGDQDTKLSKNSKAGYRPVQHPGLRDLENTKISKANESPDSHLTKRRNMKFWSVIRENEK